MWMPVMIAALGFIAQMINSTIGMAFGIISTTALVSLSFSAPLASSIVHLAEITTSAANGIFHFRNRNIDLRVFLMLSIPGGIGAFLGALALSKISLSSSKPLTSAILLVLGIGLIYRFARKGLATRVRTAMKRFLVPLGFTAGLIDANAGGGWGTIVTSTLQSSNVLSPRMAIGTSTSARFTVAVMGSLGFIIGLGAENIDWAAVIALSLGGLIAAPIAAKVVAKSNQALIGLFSGIVVSELSLRTLLMAMGLTVGQILLGMTLAAIVLGLMIRYFKKIGQSS